jgi:hypothetical protein
VLRRVLIILLDDGIKFETWVESPVEDPAADVLDRAIGALNDPDQNPGGGGIACAAADCTLYDWSFRALPHDIAYGQIPEPGVLVAVSADGAAKYAEGDEPASPMLLREVVRMSVRTDETYGPRLQHFLAGPDALWEPDPILSHDAFVSYSTRDGLLAHEIVRDLGTHGLQCFVAEISLAAGRLWAEELRLALASSRAGVILVTPQSVSSSWVLAEVGAIWSHAKPVIPVLAEIDPADVPAPLQPHMGQAVEAGDRDRLAAMLEELRR